MDNNTEKNSKDLWDKVHAIGPLMSGVLIALIGGIFTYNYRAREMAVREVSAFQAYISHLKEPKEREIALVMIEHFGDSALFMKLLETGAAGTEKIGDDRMSRALQLGQTQQSVDTVRSIPKDSAVVLRPAETRKVAKGWVYLGDYASAEREWRTRYFDFDSATDPYSLKNQSLRVATRAVNVRKAMPNESGTFGAIIDILDNNSSVYVRDVIPWLSTGYMWADVEYVKLESESK